MTDFDTSSYPKASLPVQKSPLEIASQVGSLQQQQLGISQAKLDQANQGLTYLARAMASLGPNATKDQYKAAGDQVTRQLGLPPEKTQIWNEQVDAAPDGPTFFKQAMSQIGGHQEILNLQTGQNSTATDSANVYQGKTDVMTGGFRPATQMAVQPPPTQPNVNNQPTVNGQPNPSYLQPGIVGPSAAPGVVPARPAGLPVAPQNTAHAVPAPQSRPLSALTTGPTGPTVQTGYNFNQRFAGEPIATGAPPGVASAMETVGKQSGVDYAADLTRAKNFQSDLYPMQKVLEIIKEEGTKAFGPGTDQLTNLKSALVTWGNVDQKTADSVSNIQQAKKYLVQSARSAGNTGTNDQLAAAFEANPNTTMSGATIETVVKSNIALRKMQQAQTLLFGKQNLPDSEYSKWISKNQNVLDPRAFGFDMMDSAAKTKLMGDIATKDKSGEFVAKKGKEREFNKFKDSLQFAHDSELISPGGK